MSVDKVYRLGLKDAAAAFGISYSRIYEGVTNGELVAVRFGVRWLVKPEDVETWITNNSESNQPS